MNDWIRTLPVVSWCLGIYLALSGMAVAGFVGSGVFDVVLFVWPYLGTLAIQEVIGPPTNAKLALALLFGLIVVGLAAGAIQMLIGIGKPQGRQAPALALLVTLLTLAFITAAAFSAASILGWSVGE